MDENQIPAVADPIVTEQEKREALDALLAATATVNDERLIAASNMADGAELFSQMGRVVREFVDGETTKLREEFGTKGASGMRYLGIWRVEQQYAAGDVVTFAGSGWIAEKSTSSKPGDAGDGWRLAIKRGDRGPQGDIGPMPRHEWKGTELRFEQDPGVWGKYTDLRGPAGEAGIGGGGFGAGVLNLPERNTYMPSGW